MLLPYLKYVVALSIAIQRASWALERDEIEI